MVVVARFYTAHIPLLYQPRSGSVAASMMRRRRQSATLQPSGPLSWSPTIPSSDWAVCFLLFSMQARRTTETDHFSSGDHTRTCNCAGHPAEIRDSFVRFPHPKPGSKNKMKIAPKTEWRTVKPENKTNLPIIEMSSPRELVTDHLGETHPYINTIK